MYFTSFAVSSCVSRSTRTAVASDFVSAASTILARIGRAVVDIYTIIIIITIIIIMIIIIMKIMILSITLIVLITMITTIKFILKIIISVITKRIIIVITTIRIIILIYQQQPCLRRKCIIIFIKKFRMRGDIDSNANNNTRPTMPTITRRQECQQ